MSVTKFIKLSLVLTILSLPSLGAAFQGTVDIDLDTGTTVSMIQYPSEGKSLFLIFPSERGLRKGMVSVVSSIADDGHDVWAADLHQTYMLPTGRNSIAEFDTADGLAILRLAKSQGFNEVYIATQGRGAQFVLKTARLWQEEMGGPDILKGLVFSLPHLLEGRPKMGQKANYLPMASQSNLPIYILMPEFSTKYARSQEILNELQKGGSSVYLHTLQGIKGGFQSRPVSGLTQRDLDAKAQLPKFMSFAMSMLRDIKPPPLTRNAAEMKPAEKVVAFREPSLYPFSGTKEPPPLKLDVFQQAPFDLSAIENEVVLVNFWATWCGPCIEEIPSLSRLVEHMKDKPFRVVTINIGEPEQVIAKFVEKIPLNFPILLDRHGKAVRDWNVYAYPSNFLLDRDGKIQYAYRGALEWDSSTVVNTIESLF